PDPGAVTLATMLPAAVVVFAAALVRHDVTGAWPFFLMGLLAPGLSQVFFTFGIREIGASRVSVTVGAAPLAAVTIALLFLDEPLKLPLVLGALAIVGGGVLLVGERDRPGHLRGRGLAFAAAATLLAGLVCSAIWARRLPTRVELRRLSPAGLMFGVSYICLFEAYWRGRVTVVSPLVATESLWGVALSALLVRHTEGMGRRIAIGAVLIVAGGAVIGATQ